MQNNPDRVSEPSPLAGSSPALQRIQSVLGKHRCNDRVISSILQNQPYQNTCSHPEVHLTTTPVPNLTTAMCIVSLLQEKLQEAKLPQTKVLHAPNARQQHTATFPQHRCGILCSRVSMLVSAVGQKDPGP